MRAMAARTRVVASLVGPFARYGSALVAACAAEGTHYCDTTGEVQWVREMIQQHHGAAKQTGARIVHCCGFDSIPSDLGVWQLEQYALEHFGAPCERVTFHVRVRGGALSGGTLHSMLTLAEQLAGDRRVAKVLADPYSLDPEDVRGVAPSTDRYWPSYDRARHVWTAPFLMAGVNTRIVRRSNALLGHRYGRALRYEERMPTGEGVKGLAGACAVSGALAVSAPAMLLAPVRTLLSRYVLPKPGEGPSAEQRARSSYRIEIHGATADGSVALHAHVAGRSDPGYGETAKMITESALCLALDELTSEGGVLTPAAAMAEPLIERLRKAGQTYDVEVVSASREQLAQHTRRQQAQQLTN